MHAVTSVKRPYLILLLLLCTLVLYFVGIFAPLMTVKKGFFFIYVSGKPVSIVSGLWQFLVEGNYILFVLIFVFTLSFPLFKFYILFKLCIYSNKNMYKTQALARRLAHVGKWSMLDVFVVAVLIVAVKIRSIAKVEVHYGLYVFATAILLSMLLTYVLAHRQLVSPDDNSENRSPNI